MHERGGVDAWDYLFVSTSLFNAVTSGLLRLNQNGGFSKKNIQTFCKQSLSKYDLLPSMNRKFGTFKKIGVVNVNEQYYNQDIATNKCIRISSNTFKT